MKDTSPDAYSPSLGAAANIISITVIIFFLFIMFIFWLSTAGEKHKAKIAASTPGGDSAER
jgi:hypothetical protein